MKPQEALVAAVSNREMQKGDVNNIHVQILFCSRRLSLCGTLKIFEDPDSKFTPHFFPTDIRDRLVQVITLGRYRTSNFPVSCHRGS